VPIDPRVSPGTGADIDMSMCFLRSMSPIHVRYLKNMGVSGTLVISLVVGGQLWGLIACHHYAARVIPYDLCIASALLAEAVATRIAACEGHSEAQLDRLVRRFETHLLENTSRFGDWKSALFDGPQYLLKPLDADGAALLIDDDVFTSGTVPGTHEVREMDGQRERHVDRMDAGDTQRGNAHRPECGRHGPAFSIRAHVDRERPAEQGHTTGGALGTAGHNY
jgi:light-regulated signal transduction histidine kinase (bacteriophytochrome)